MRSTLIPTLLALAVLTLGGCASSTAETDSDTDTGPLNRSPDAICDDFADPGDTESCLDGCDEGEAYGWDQGRLACILGGDYAPNSVRDEESPFMDGFRACYRVAYREGWVQAGCEVA